MSTATLERPAPPIGDGDPDDVRRWRLRHAALCLVLVALTFNTSAGRTSPDTKVDLTADPWQFLGRSLHLWDGQAFSGQLQNQAYGYLFPMGPFFGVWHSLGVPGWVAERLWWAALLCVAYLGVVLLARALDLGSPATRMLGGVAFACSPHVLTLLGANSVESLPMCVAPWVVLPLVRGLQHGDHRRAGLLCGVAALAMGGVNAAADLGGLLPAVLFVLVQRPPRRLVAWAVLGVALATAWWVVPLLLLGRYSPPFLDYIEDADTTTAVTSLAETLRGTADWVAYLPSSGWHAGFELLTRPVLVLDTLLVVAVGLAGLAGAARRRSAGDDGTVVAPGRGDLRWRGWALTCLGVGLVLVTLGHPGTVGPLGATAERDLLDGVLAPIRNVHKFDVLVRLPIALGLVDLVSRLRWGRTDVERRRAGVLVHVVAAVAVVGAATPLITLQAASAGSYDSLPGYWREAASWLAQQDPADGRALLVPASPTPTYLWGTPTDEPLQPLAGAPWDVRDNIPLTTPGHVRVLDEVEQLLAAGRSQPGLAAYLQRAGIGYLVERSDLSYGASGTLPPAVVHATLSSSPGLSEVAIFGPVIGNPGDFSYSVDQGLDVLRPAVEVWRVDPGPTTTDARVAVVPAAGLARLSGGPESLASLAQDGTAPAATVQAGQSAAGLSPGSAVLTDGLRRREVNYGAAPGQRSPTLTAADDGAIGRRVMDYTVVDGVEHQSVVRYLGATEVAASTSAAQPGGFYAVRPDEQPWSAFDGDAGTAWISAPGSTALGQWLEVDLDHAVSGGGTLQLTRPTGVARVSVSTDSGSGPTTRSYPVGGEGRVELAAADGLVHRVRVTVTGLVPGYRGQVGVSALDLDGAGLSRTVVTPRDATAGRPVDLVDLSTPGDARDGCLVVQGAPQCVVGRARASEDGSTLDRTVALPVRATYGARVTVVPRPGPALDHLIATGVGRGLHARVSTQGVPDPLAGPATLVDGDPSTGWVAAVEDPDPMIRLRWRRPVTVDHLRLGTSASLAATRADRVEVDARGTRATTVVDDQGTVRFPPVRTRRLTLHLRSAEGLRRVVASTVPGQVQVGIGLDDVKVPGVRRLTRAATDARPVRLPCGAGPDLVVDGVVTRTRLDTTVAALRDLDPVEAVPCGTPSAGVLSLAAGDHRLQVLGTDRWTADSLRLVRLGAGDPAAGVAPTDVAVRSWDDTSRSVEVGARTAPALLLVDENANPGWQASLDGRSLPSLTIDGWRQGYVVPPGAAGVVTLSFAPQRVYAAGLVGGAVAVLLLLLATAWAVRHRRPAVSTESGHEVAAPRRAGRRRRLPALLPPRTGPALAAVLLCTLLGGPVGALVGTVTAGVLLAASARGRGRGEHPERTGGPRSVAAPVLAALAIVVVALLLAHRPWGGPGYAADTLLLQVVCLVGIAATITGPDGGTR